MIEARLKIWKELRKMERNELVQLRYEILKLKVYVSTADKKRAFKRVRKCDELIRVIENIIDGKEGRDESNME